MDQNGWRAYFEFSSSNTALPTTYSALIGQVIYIHLIIRVIGTVHTYFAYITYYILHIAAKITSSAYTCVTFTKLVQWGGAFQLNAVHFCTMQWLTAMSASGLLCAVQ